MRAGETFDRQPDNGCLVEVVRQSLLVRAGEEPRVLHATVLAFGVIFQMPTIVFFLARLGLVSAGFLLRHTKYAILIIFIIAAVISPGTDVVSQCLMAGPMLGLYGISILVAWIFAKRKTEAD